MSGPLLLILRLLLAASLYAFLGIALFVLWQDLKVQSGKISQKITPPISVIYQQDEDYTTFNFNLPEITIGRDPACDCVIEDSTVSAQHARLAFRQNQWWVEDLHSTNGTYLNSEIVLAPLVITNSDRLRCGQALFTIKLNIPGNEALENQ
jgi:pSer/pThr/pTyr-binding forkhead associated (FHA) protein